MKTFTAWVVVSPKGNAFHDTVGYLRRDSIKLFLEPTGFDSFDSYYREGYRCVKITCEVVENLWDGAE